MPTALCDHAKGLVLWISVGLEIVREISRHANPAVELQQHVDCEVIGYIFLVPSGHAPQPQQAVAELVEEDADELSVRHPKPVQKLGTEPNVTSVHAERIPRVTRRHFDAEWFDDEHGGYSVRDFAGPLFDRGLLLLAELAL